MIYISLLSYLFTKVKRSPPIMSVMRVTQECGEAKTLTAVLGVQTLIFT